LQVLRNLAKKCRAEFLQFFIADAADAGKFCVARRIKPPHLPQGNVGENNVRRHAAFIGKLFAERAEFFKQRLVARDFSGAMFLRFGGRNGFGERDFLPRLERGASGIGDFDDAELLRVLEKKSEPDKLAPDCAPLGAIMFAADVVVESS